MPQTRQVDLQDTQAENAHQRRLLPLVHLQTPEQWHRNHDAEQYVGDNVQRHIHITQRLDGVRTPARPGNGRIPLYREIGALQHNREKAADSVEAHKDHDADDNAAVDRSHGYPQQEEAHGDLDEADGEQVDGLRYEVEFIAVGKVDGVNVLLVSSSPQVDFGDDDDLTHDTLPSCQKCTSPSRTRNDTASTYQDHGCNHYIVVPAYISNHAYPDIQPRRHCDQSCDRHCQCGS